MLHSNSAQGQGGSHLTLMACTLHAHMTQALAHFKRTCRAIGHAAVKLAEDINMHIEIEFTRRCPLMLPIKHMVKLLTEQLIERLSEQLIEQPMDMPIEQPIEQPTDMLSEQSIEQPMDMLTKQPMDMPSKQSIEQPSEQSIEQLTDNRQVKGAVDRHGLRQCETQHVGDGDA